MRLWSGSCPITCSIIIVIIIKYCKIWSSISRWASPSGWNIARASHRWPPTATNLSPRVSEKNTENSLKKEQKTKSWSLWEVIYHTFSPRPKAKAKAKIKTKTKKTTNSKSKSKSHWEGWPEHKHFAPKTKRETEPLRIIFWTKKTAVPYNTNTTGLWQEFFCYKTPTLQLASRSNRFALYFSNDSSL